MEMVMVYGIRTEEDSEVRDGARDTKTTGSRARVQAGVRDASCRREGIELSRACVSVVVSSWCRIASSAIAAA